MKNQVIKNLSPEMGKRYWHIGNQEGLIQVYM